MFPKSVFKINTSAAPLFVYDFISHQGINTILLDCNKIRLVKGLKSICLISLGFVCVCINESEKPFVKNPLVICLKIDETKQIKGVSNNVLSQGNVI